MKSAKRILAVSDDAEDLYDIGPTTFAWAGDGDPAPASGAAAPSPGAAAPDAVPGEAAPAGTAIVEALAGIQAQPDTSLIRLDKFRADPRFAGIDGSGLAVAVLDTGIDLNHPFFGADGNFNGVADRIVYSYNFVGTNAPGGQDGNGHGSNVASIIGSQNGTYTGMAPGVNIISLKVLSDSGSGSTLDIGEALSWVVANSAAYKVVAVNLSLGYGDNVNVATASPFASQFASLAAAGVAVVAASGNSYHGYQSQGVATPSSDPNAWSVGAVWDRNAGGGYYWSSGAIDYSTQADQVISFSQRSASLTTVMAPGGQITGANWNGGTVTYSGTSQAAPHVAGLVADMQQLAFRTSGRFLGVADLEQTMLAGAATIFDGTSTADNVVNTNASYARVDALGWGVQVLAKLFAGTAVADTLTGTVVADTMHGAAGNDALAGNDGGDFLYGDAGNDSLAGGNGADRFYFASGGGADRIVDFSRVQGDRIDLTGVGNVGSFADLLSRATQSGANTVVDFGGGDVLTLDGVSRASLLGSDFAFSSVVESSGAIRLTQAGDVYTVAAVAGGAPAILSYGGVEVGPATFAPWTPVAAEAAGAGYIVAWKYAGAGQYAIWSVDAAGALIASPTGVVSGASLALQSYETRFAQDLNADGTTGVVTSTIENVGATGLVKAADTYWLNAYGGTALTLGGTAVTQGMFGAWTPVAAESTNGNVSFQVAWRFGSADLYTVWTVDGSGGYAGQTATFAGATAALWSYETLFGQDLDGDTTIGAPTATIEAIGATRLVQAGNNFSVAPVAGGASVQLNAFGAAVVAGQFGDFAPIAAEATASGYAVAWKSAGADQYTVLNADSHGTFQSHAFFVVAGGSLSLQSIEPSFAQDLNGDGTVGIVSTVVEAAGATRLVQVADTFSLGPVGGGLAASLRFGGATVTADTFGPWHPVGAEAVSGGYEVVWQQGSADRYAAWLVDGGGNMLSSPTGVVSGGAAALQSLETLLGQDINGDGTVGPLTTVIEAAGATRLVQVADTFSLGPVGGGLAASLRFGGATVTADTFGPWHPVGAEAVSGGYEVVWQQGSADRYAAWLVDGGGNMLSSPTGVVSGGAAALQSLETLLGQDINGDGTVGPLTTVIEAAGATRLVQVADTFSLGPVGGGLAASLRFGGATVTADTFGPWHPVGAEAVSGGYEVVWQQGGADQFAAWLADGSGNMLSSPTGIVSGASATLRALELQFAQDFNGDITVGSVAATPAHPGAVEAVASPASEPPADALEITVPAIEFGWHA